MISVTSLHKKKFKNLWLNQPQSFFFLSQFLWVRNLGRTCLDGYSLLRGSCRWSDGGCNWNSSGLAGLLPLHHRDSSCGLSTWTSLDFHNMVASGHSPCLPGDFCSSTAVSGPQGQTHIHFYDKHRKLLSIISTTFYWL